MTHGEGPGRRDEPRSGPTRSGPTRGDGLLHPVPVLAIAVLVLNDHWGKFAFPGLLTGKLSDVAGMVFFPLMLQAMLEVLDRREPFRPSRRALLGCAVATGLVFSAINLHPAAARVYEVGLGVIQWPFRMLLAMGWVPRAEVGHTLDPWDVVAAPFVIASVAVGWKRTEHA